MPHHILSMYIYPCFIRQLKPIGTHILLASMSKLPSRFITNVRSAIVLFFAIRVPEQLRYYSWASRDVNFLLDPQVSVPGKTANNYLKTNCFRSEEHL